MVACPHRICKACLGGLLTNFVDACPLCPEDNGGFGYQCQGTNTKNAISLDCMRKSELFAKPGNELDRAKYMRLMQEQVQMLREVIEERQNIFPPGAASCNLGCALRALGELEKAGVALQQSLKESSNDAKANYTLGMVRLMAYNPVAAIAPLQRAVELGELQLRDGMLTSNADLGMLEDYRNMLGIAREDDWPRPELRFKVGDKVEALVDGGWKSGKIEEIWYREEHWPAEKPTVPYQIWVPGHEPVDLVFANYDLDAQVRAQKV